MKNFQPSRSHFSLHFLWCIGLMSSVAPLHAQVPEKNKTTGNQQWIQYYNQATLSKKWSWLFDAGFRWKDNLSAPSQYLVRTSFNYKIFDDLSVGGGVACFGNYSGNEVNKREFRPFGEVTLRSTNGLQHRLRIEDRYFRNYEDGEFVSDNKNVRFRYRVQVSIPLANFNPQKLSLSIGDELFINAGKEIVYNVFDQNRFLVSPTFEFSKSLSASVTYNAMYSAQNKPSSYSFYHVIWLGITSRMNFSRKS